MLNQPMMMVRSEEPLSKCQLWETSTTLAKRLFIHPDEANGLLSEGVQIDCRDMLGDPQEAHTHRYRFGNEENMNKPR
jgi:hypothetical protein